MLYRLKDETLVPFPDALAFARGSTDMTRLQHGGQGKDDLWQVVFRWTSRWSVARPEISKLREKVVNHTKSSSEQSETEWHA